MNVFKKTKKTSELFSIIGSFGKIDENVDISKNGVEIVKNDIKLKAEIKKSDSGVFRRKDFVTNLSEESVALYSLGSKFTLDGGEWEVYTQYNGWQSESLGGWVPLVSSVVSRCNSVRSSHDATPFMALWNKQSERGIAFHIVTGAAWQMRVSRLYSNGSDDASLEVELGVLPDGFCYELKAKETLPFPEILYYEFESKRDMGSYKLHEYMNELYPRREMPVVYNTWLAKFDSFSFESLEEQLPRAKEIGAEYFVIDAGWFGYTKSWWSGRGDWVENPEIGFKGRMREFADKVREYGMKFGFWIEPESSSGNSEKIKEHPEYFVEGNRSYFLDFTNPEAYSYILETVCALIEKLGAEYIKFDFNADLEYDKDHSAFIKYAEAHERFIKEIHQRHPEVYLENCGSGGARMTLRDGMLYDGFWPSDNESPYDGLRIYKDTLRRMPAQWIDCWTAIASVKGATPVYSVASEDKIIACGDAIWNHVEGVHPSYLKAFLSGSPIGLSFDLNSLTEDTFLMLKEFIAQFKERRDFYKSQTARLIADTETVTAIEYADKALKEIEVILFVNKRLQDGITLYPAIDVNLTYVNEQGETILGKDLASEGISFDIEHSYTAFVYRMRAVTE
jgi:alpha-galactosidase